MRATTKILSTIVLILGSSIFTGCGDHGSSNTTDGGPTGGSGAVPATSWTFSSSDCPADYPLPLTVSTTVDRERPYVKKVVACTSDEQYGPVWLHNVGNEVWTFNGEKGHYEFLDATPESNVFYATFSTPTILDPDDVLLVQAPPGKVSWTLNPAYTVAWDTQTEAVEQLKTYSQAAFVAAVKNKSSEAHAALVACTLSAFNAADTWSGNPDGFDENLGAALGTGAGAAACAAKWETALQTKFELASRFLEKVDTRFRLFSTFGEHALILVP